jgi:hypothetical protein
MKGGRKMFGFEYSLEHVCSYTVLLHPPEVIGPVGEGIRANFQFAGGEVDGPKLQGRFRPGGVDFATMRRDGIGILDIRGIIETHDGARIYLVGSGLAYGGENDYERAIKRDLAPTVPLRVAICLQTAHPGYAWVNRFQFVSIGELVRTRNEVRADLYALK